MIINLSRKNQIKNGVAVLACGFLAYGIVKNTQAASLSSEIEENQVEEISFWDKIKIFLYLGQNSIKILFYLYLEI